MSKAPQYIDDPEKRKAVWANNPKAVDQYGNKLIMIGHYWCSCSYERLMQLAKETPEDGYIIVVRVSDGRPFGRQRGSFTRAAKHWKRRIETGWYVFIDPITQVIF